jgi:hypothetical protein
VYSIFCALLHGLRRDAGAALASGRRADAAQLVLDRHALGAERYTPSLPFEPKRVESVEGGPAAVEFRVLSRDGGEVVIAMQLPLAATDFLLLWRDE